jgi:monovalent cation/hydrogen antiporter
METPGLVEAQILLLLLIVGVAALAALARRFQTPYPIVLVIGGLIISLIPGMPQVSLNPDIVFLVLLPPLLFASAFQMSWRDFRSNISSILLLVFGLVTITVVGVAYWCNWFLPGFDFRAGMVLGAVVSTTDAIAASSIARRLGLPERIIDIIEGESLVNDATGLIALEITVVILVSGKHVSLAEGSLSLLYLIVGGVVAGLLVAWLMHWIQRYVTDSPIEITISLLAPYVSYLAADEIHASGVLAVVVCGLYFGRRNSVLFTTRARIESAAVWETLDFLLNGLVFIVMGLQLRSVLAGIKGASLTHLILWGLIFSALLIALRLLLVFPGSQLAYLIDVHLLRRERSAPSVKEVFVLGWTGMRGVVALAAAISLPEKLEGGAPFPQRNLVIFLTFCVILVTLVFQGLSLPWLIRKLGFAEEGGRTLEELQARRAMIHAALKHIADLADNESDHERSVLDDIAGHYRQRLALIDCTDPEPEIRRYQSATDLSQELRGVERSTAVKLRDQDRISDLVLRKLERELDLLDTRFQRRIS